LCWKVDDQVKKLHPIVLQSGWPSQQLCWRVDDQVKKFVWHIKTIL